MGSQNGCDNHSQLTADRRRELRTESHGQPGPTVFPRTDAPNRAGLSTWLLWVGYAPFTFWDIVCVVPHESTNGNSHKSQVLKGMEHFAVSFKACPFRILAQLWMGLRQAAKQPRGSQAAKCPAASVARLLFLTSLSPLAAGFCSAAVDGLSGCSDFHSQRVRFISTASSYLEP